MKKLDELFGVVIMLGVSPLLFAGSPYQQGDGLHGIIGLGVLFRTEPIETVDNRIWPLPLLIMRHGNFFIDGLEMGYHAVEGVNGQINIIFRPRLEGFNANDSAFLDGMADRDFSIDGGIASTWRQETLEVKFSAVTDVLRKNKGKEMTLSVGNTYILTGRMLLFTPSLGLRWQSEELINYYYGVIPTEARADRPAYKGEATMNYTAAINATYSLSKRSTLFADVEYERFGDDISDSPLVEGEQIFTVFFGYGWQF